MPVEDTITPGEHASETAVAEAIYANATLVREVTIARAGRRAPIVHRLAVSVTEGEDARVVAQEAAARVVEIAERDADGTRRRYHVAILGAMPIGRKAPTLATITITTDPEDPEDDRDNASTTRAAARLVGDVGDRHVRLLDQTIGIIERVHPLAAASEAASAERVRAEGETKVRMTELAIGERERAQYLTLAVEVLPVVQPIIAAFTSWLTAKAEQLRKDPS